MPRRTGEVCHGKEASQQCSASTTPQRPQGREGCRSPKAAEGSLEAQWHPFALCHGVGASKKQWHLIWSQIYFDPFYGALRLPNWAPKLWHSLSRFPSLTRTNSCMLVRIGSLDRLGRGLLFWLLTDGFKVSLGTLEWYRSSYGTDFDTSEIAGPLGDEQRPALGALGASCTAASCFRHVLHHSEGCLRTDQWQADVCILR